MATMAAIVTIVASGGHTVALAGQPQHETVRAWFDAEWERSLKFPSFDGYSIAFETADHLPVDPDEVARLRAQVKGKPEHPQFADLMQYEAMLKAPVVNRFRVFSGGQDRWRFNADMQGGVWLDVAISDRASWNLTSDILRLFDRSQEGIDLEQSVGSHTYTFMPILGRILWGGLTLGRQASLTPSDFRVAGDRWSVTLATKPESPPNVTFHVVVEGRWDDSAKRGFAEALKVIKNGFAPEAVGESDRYLDWTYEPAAQRWLCRRIEQFDPKGKLLHVYRLLSIEPLPAGGLDAVLRAPEPTGEDVIRGPLTVRHFEDRASRKYRSVAGGVVSESRPLPMSSTPKRPSTSWLRPVGWTILAVLVVTFIAMKFRRAAA